VTGAKNQVFKPSLTQNYIRLNTYKTSAKPMLPYGSKVWTIRKADKKYNF
jgi:hypothetical protein